MNENINKLTQQSAVDKADKELFASGKAKDEASEVMKPAPQGALTDSELEDVAGGSPAPRSWLYHHLW
jgi:hypothetical protein